MKLLFVLSLFVFNLFAMEIDHLALEEIVSNDPSATKEKVLLAKYYFKNENNLKASSLLDEVLEFEPKNSAALKIKKQIEQEEHIKGVFREAGLSKPITTLEAQKRLNSFYTANNYQFYSTLYQALSDSNVKLDDSYHIKAAYIYLWDARYNYSEKALIKLDQENNIDAAKIRADICYYTGKYRCSAKIYEKLYNTSYKIETAVKLINSYIYLGQTAKAQRLYNYLYRKYPNNKELNKIGNTLLNSKNSYLENMKKEYEKERNFQTLSTYTSALYASGEKDKTIELINNYNKDKATNESLLLEAKYLIWESKTPKALEILKHGSLNNDLQAKLMLGQVYSWDHHFEESKINLNEVIAKTEDSELLFNAKKARAYVYMWEKEDTLAKKLFKELLQEKPKDSEIKEALMELNHDYTGLIKIYRARVNASSKLSDTKRLGELYVLNKQPSAAIEYLQKYIQDNPSDLEATKILATLLIENKDYYQGFGYLEYYAAQKQTAQSSILLAKNYYWHGFSKEALDVLDALLKKEPKNEEALKLKAKILKVSPRFTTSNSGATTGMYFDNLGKKQLFLADTLYFNSHYKASLAYFESYLESHPNDHEVRYRYAFALENAKEYGKAEGEFSLIFWTKDSDELRYHYAYNMMKNSKLKEAEELLKTLKKSTYKTISPALNSFLESWKNSWQSQNFSEYVTHYSDSFANDEIWAFRKQEKFSDLTYISVGIYEAVSKEIDDNNYEIRFYQEYSTNRNSDKGYKTLIIDCDTNQTECKITKESWKTGEFKKSLLLMPYIDRSLKEIEFLKAHPTALNDSSKKKTLYYKLNLQNIMILS